MRRRRPSSKLGECALFYSDGLVEAHDPKGEMFGFPRLRALVAEHGEEGSLGETSLGGTLLLRRGGLGAGGRHHPPYTQAFRIPKLNCREQNYKKKKKKKKKRT